MKVSACYIKLAYFGAKFEQAHLPLLATTDTGRNFLNFCKKLKLFEGKFYKGVLSHNEGVVLIIRKTIFVDLYGKVMPAFSEVMDAARHTQRISEA